MTTFRLVRHHLVLDYFACGWMITHDLQDCCHGRWAVLMVFPCTCPHAEPMN